MVYTARCSQFTHVYIRHRQAGSSRAPYLACRAGCPSQSVCALAHFKRFNSISQSVPVIA